MNNSHPSEKEIHDFALDKSVRTTVLIDHIESCARCKAEVETYQYLFSEIKQSPQPAFDFDLSALVIPQLPHTQTGLSADRFIAGFLILFICCLIGIPVILFRQYILNMFSGIPSFFIYAIIISAFIIVVINILDMYRKYQKQMRLLNYH